MSLTLLYEHVVFAPKHRAPCLLPEKEEMLFRYIWGIVKRQGCALIRVNAALDHIHLLLRRHPSLSTSELVAHIKRASSLWIGREKVFPGFPGWSREYAAFSVSHRELGAVRDYVAGQKEHHRLVSFMDEYLSFVPPEMRENVKAEYFND